MSSGYCDQVKLNPAVYQCDEHDVDLTDAVTAELTQIPVTSFGVGFVRSLVHKRPSTREFCVVVTCPGAHGHQLLLNGHVDESE